MKTTHERRYAISGEIKAETDTTWLFSDGVQETWLPKSRCRWDADNQVMDMPEWMAFASKLV